VTAVIAWQVLAQAFLKELGKKDTVANTGRNLNYEQQNRHKCSYFLPYHNNN